MPLTKISLVGANGNLGPAILHALLAAEDFDITIITRRSSKSSYPPTVHVAHTSDDPSLDELVPILRGQDALIISFAGSNDTLQIRYADAAAVADVHRFIPADFGSCDSSSPRALDLIPLYRAKQRVRRHLQDLAARGTLSWTSLVCGHLFDWGLGNGFLQFDLKGRRAVVFDGGREKWSASTTGQVGRAVVGVLRAEEETRDRMLYLQSFCVSQMQVLEAMERVTGQEWQVEYVSSEEYIKGRQAKLREEPEDAEEWEKMVSVVGMIDADWQGKPDFANSLLGLKEEDLNQVVKASLHP